MRYPNKDRKRHLWTTPFLLVEMITNKSDFEILCAVGSRLLFLYIFTGTVILPSKIYFKFVDICHLNSPIQNDIWTNCGCWWLFQDQFLYWFIYLFQPGISTILISMSASCLLPPCFATGLAGIVSLFSEAIYWYALYLFCTTWLTMNKLQPGEVIELNI